MTSFDAYRWPAKLKKFGIDDPFLKILAAKYEKDIPWQGVVRNSETLNQFIKADLLPMFLAKLALPDAGASKNYYYLGVHDVALDTYLNAEINRNNPNIQVIYQIRLAQGDAAATKQLVHYLNLCKQQAFKVWFDFLESTYPGEYAFHFLLLKPVFDQSGKGVRRALAEPSANMVDWLHRRIISGKVTPDDNLAKHYYLKLGLGQETDKANGWQFIPAGFENVEKLTAASAGSGWCVAGSGYASDYLCNCDFYILRINHKPAVALRVSYHDQTIVECRGRFNDFPEDFVNEILLFYHSHPFNQFDHGLDRLQSKQDDLEVMPFDWWQKQTEIWPFAIILAPSFIQDELIFKARSEACQYPHFKHFPALAKRLGVELDTNSWAVIIENNPQRFMICPPDMKDKSVIRQACIAGWQNRVVDDQLTVDEIKSMPVFVKEEHTFQQLLHKCFPTAIHQTIRKQPTTYEERTGRFSLNEQLPEVENESPKWVVERMVNVLLNNEDGIYSDAQFPESQRQRADFAELREQAWLEAMRTHPPLWFALPADLKQKDQFNLSQKVPAKIDLAEWCAKVQAKPWILLQRSGVPKAIRLHSDILQAYREGWLPHLRKSPWRIWLPVGQRRVYMSYALLEDKQALQAMTDGWLNQKTRFVSSWFSLPSKRMSDLPAVQLAAMRAAMQIKSFTKLAVKDGDTLNLCGDIFMRLKEYRRQNRPESRLHGEIKILLGNRGIR